MQTPSRKDSYVSVDQVLLLISRVTELAMLVSLTGKAHPFVDFAGHVRSLRYSVNGACSLYKSDMPQSVIFDTCELWIDRCTDSDFARLCEFYCLLESYIQPGQLQLELVG